MNIERHRAFLESLEGEKGLPEEIRRFRLIKLGDDKKLHRSSEGEWVRYQDHLDAIEILESRQIPDLKEKVKELVRAYVDAERTRTRSAETQREWNEFRALCEPDKGQDVI